MNDQILDEREVFAVKRESDGALIGVYYTKIDANQVLTDYQDQWNEECYVTPEYIPGQQTVQQRNDNAEE